MASRVLRPEAGVHLRADGSEPVRPIPEGIEDEGVVVLVRRRVASADLVLIVAELQSPRRVQWCDRELEIARDVEVCRPLAERELASVKTRRRVGSHRDVDTVDDVHVEHVAPVSGAEIVVPARRLSLQSDEPRPIPYDRLFLG